MAALKSAAFMVNDCVGVPAPQSTVPPSACTSNVVPMRTRRYSSPPLKSPRAVTRTVTRSGSSAGAAFATTNVWLCAAPIGPRWPEFASTWSVFSQRSPRLFELQSSMLPVSASQQSWTPFASQSCAAISSLSGMAFRSQSWTSTATV